MKSMKNMDINALSAVFYDKSNLKLKSAEKPAFTLAEMMVVMLIVSIVLAAMAPVITTKMKRDMNNSSAGGSSIWSWTEDKDAIYFNADGGKQPVMVGQTKVADTDPEALLVLNTEMKDNIYLAGRSHILFKRRDMVLGRLRFDYVKDHLGEESHGILLGSLSSTSNPRSPISGISIGNSNRVSNDAIVIGNNSVTYTDATVVGVNAKADSVSVTGHSNSPRGAVVIGNSAESSGGDGAVVIGKGAVVIRDKGIDQGDAPGAIAIGSSARVYNGTGGLDNNYVSTQAQGAIAIGRNANSQDYSGIFGGAGSTLNSNAYASIAIGAQADAKKGGIAIGSESIVGYSGSYELVTTSAGEKAVAIGIGAKASTDASYNFGAIAIGTNANSSGSWGISIGENTEAGQSSITIGRGAKAGSSSVAVGENASSGEYHSVAIGNGAKAKGEDSVAVGYNACKNVTGKNKVCIGASSGPASSSNWATDNVERIFIGSKSKFNDGAAVLEVHNDEEKLTELDGDKGKNLSYPKTAVVVNGNLIVKGAIISALPSTRGDDHGFMGAGGAKVGFITAPGDSDNIHIAKSHGSYSFINYYAGYGGFRSPKGTIETNITNGGISSDRRLKYVGKENKDGLDKLRELKVFNYTFKKDPSKEPRVGVIAQDLQKVFPNAVKKGSDGFLTIRMEDMFYAVVNAVKELDMKVTEILKRVQDDKMELDAKITGILKQVQDDKIELDAKVAGILKQIQNDKKEIQALKKENKELKARIEKLEAKIK